MNKKLKQSYKIDDVWNNYESLIKELFNEIKKDFERRHDEIELIMEKRTFKIRKNNFLTNIILWNSFKEIDTNKFSEKYVLDLQKNIVTTDLLAKYFDELIELFYNEPKKISFTIAKTLSILDKISRNFNPYIANTISIYSLINLANKNKEVNDLLHYKIDETKQSNENERLIEKHKDRLVEILKQTDNCLCDYLVCGEGIKEDQLSQMILSSGYKTDLMGNVYPKAVNTNLLLGFKKPSDYILDSTGGKKASVTNFKQVKRSGYMTRKLSLLCIDSLLSDIDNCGSTRNIKLTIKSENELKRLDKRYYVNDKGELKKIRFSDKSLIGKTVSLKSPITCTCKDGKICHKCYGDLWEVNNDLHIGLLSTQFLTAQLTQMMLSAKHLLKTKPEKIEFSDNFNKFFNLVGNLIYKCDDENFTIVINKDDLEIEDEDAFLEYEEVDSNFIGKMGTSKFKIIRGKNVYEINEKKTLYFSEELCKQLKNSKKHTNEIRISLKDFTFDDVIFYLVIENKELSATLNKVINLIENKEHLGISDCDELVQYSLNLLEQAKLHPQSIHLEMILRELIRNNDGTGRPNLEKNEPYKILTATSSILNSSLAVSLSYQQFKKQLENVRTYEKETTSYLEHMFK